MAHDVFISYSSQDKPAADATCAVLERNGVRCWIAPRDILPGMSWGSSIIDAINSAHVMVLLFSDHANRSPQVEREIERAVNRSIPIIPMRIENVLPTKSLEYFISTPHWLDAFTPPLEQHLERLTEIVRYNLAAQNGTAISPKPASSAASAAQPTTDAHKAVPNGARPGTIADQNNDKPMSRQRGARPRLARPGLLLASAVTAVLLISLVVTLTGILRSVELRVPPSGPSNSELLEQIVAKNSVAQAADAVAELSRRCSESCADHQSIVSVLITALRGTGHMDRELNGPILSLLKTLLNNDLHGALSNKLARSKIELVEVDLSDANLTGVDLSDLFIILSNFRNANLTNADFSDTLLRGSDFKGATFHKTAMANADWFNSFNLDKAQFNEIAGDVLKCPHTFEDPSFRPFIEDVNSRYGIPYENYDASHQNDLKAQWRTYSGAGGLCEFADRRR